jgi:hypothetical protein
MRRRTLAHLTLAAIASACAGAGDGEPRGSEVTVAGPEVAASEGGSSERIRAAQFRRRPGPPEPVQPPAELPEDPTAVTPPPPTAFPEDLVPLPDRWRIIEDLGVRERLYDPYNQNTLKGDRPIYEDYFIVLTGISDTVVEPRSVPTPVGIQGGDPGSNDVFGANNQFLFSQTLLPSISVIKGNTAYKPQDIELRLTPAFNYNYTDVEEERVVYADPTKGTSRKASHFGLQEAFLDYHLGNISERYDFISTRAGIQPFTADFRGFLFQDVPVGVRLFGTADNNLWQYNLAWFRRFDKDINSGLNDLGEDLREDDVFVGNVYRQDFPILGMTTQAIVAYNRNRDDAQIDANGFPARPAEVGLAALREYDVTYLGLNFDGRVGPLNLTATGYFAGGENDGSLLSGRTTDIQAFFLAAEPGIDFDWVRLRLSGLYASGDSDPYDNTDTGFDAIFENPLFAGADTSYWIRQGVPLIGGGFVVLSDRNSVLPALRHSKTNGQSNFTNPGVTLLGAGADFDILPELRLSFNANYLRFNKTAVLEELRQQPDIDNTIGWDLSTAAIWRPFLNQNVVLRLSGAVLLPGDSFEQLYGASNTDDYYYSVLANAVLTY